MAMTRAGGVSVTSTYKKPKAPAITDLAGGPSGWTQPKYTSERTLPRQLPSSPWNNGPGGYTSERTLPQWLPSSPWNNGYPPATQYDPRLIALAQRTALPALPGGSGSGGGYYDNTPVNWSSGMGARGITAGGNSVPGSGSSPQSGNDYRPTGMMLLQDTYRAYMRDLQDAGTAEDQIPSFEQWMEARYNALGAMGGASNINYRNVGEYYKNLGREIERIMNPRERPPEDQAGIQQSTPGGWSPPVNQRY